MTLVGTLPGRKPFRRALRPISWMRERTLSSRPEAGRRMVSLRPSLPTFSIETCMSFPRIFLVRPASESGFVGVSVRLRCGGWAGLVCSPASPEPDVGERRLGKLEPNVVRKERLELSRVAPLEPKSSASTSSATFACKVPRRIGDGVTVHLPAGKAVAIDVAARHRGERAETDTTRRKSLPHQALARKRRRRENGRAEYWASHGVASGFSGHWCRRTVLRKGGSAAPFTSPSTGRGRAR